MVSDTSTNKDTRSKEKESENKNEEAKLSRNDFAHYMKDKRSKGNCCVIQPDFMLLTVSFIEAANQTPKSLENDVLNFPNSLNNFLNTRSVEDKDMSVEDTHGVANMSGAYGGLQKLIKDKQPRANYVHCSTHNLNLVLNDACNNVPHM
ncbi:hypothetical protein TNCV_2260021 [Trichonephila clavipes]|nr:hypothetical protein TNCV_2260021 [Trichonephila clavipes]